MKPGDFPVRYVTVYHLLAISRNQITNSENRCVTGSPWLQRVAAVSRRTGRQSQFGVTATDATPRRWWSLMDAACASACYTMCIENKESYLW